MPDVYIVSNNFNNSFIVYTIFSVFILRYMLDIIIVP